MLRLWLCLFLVLLAPTGGGVLPAVSGEVCVENCADDDPRGQCAQDCTDCTCCSHVRTVTALAPTSTRLPSNLSSSLIEHEEKEPPSADVRDILHVPRAPLA
ncbi:hypothetical protein P2318_29370 [Myxococcaceae bacterium GXIMD 01537]